MLDSVQPWLPLLDPEPLATMEERSPPSGATRARGQAQRQSSKRATAQRSTAVARQATPRERFSAGEIRALRYAFLGLVSRWDLSARDALTLMGEPLGDEGERYERLQALVGLNRSLGLLFPEPEQCRGYLRRPCPTLGGATPLQSILTGGRPAVAQLHVLLSAKI